MFPMSWDIEPGLCLGWDTFIGERFKRGYMEA